MSTRVPFRFEKLDVWQGARTLTRLIYSLTSSFPFAEQFGLTSQIRRAVISIAANIAEGSGKNSDPDFARFLEQSYGSAMETAALIQLSADLGYLQKTAADDALDKLHTLGIKIAALNRSLGIERRKTVIPGARVSSIRANRPSTLDSRPST